MSTTRAPWSALAATPRLVHEQVTGLRFDREPCHAVCTARGLRWAPLAWHADGSATARTNICAIRHALGLLMACRISATQALGLRRRHGCWRVPGPAARGTVHRGHPLGALADLACDTIRQGGVCLLEVQTVPSPHRDGSHARSVRRLMTITGVEIEQGSVSRARALLLLDPADAQPWACGHNARLLTKDASDIVTVRQTSGHLLRCRVSALIAWSARR